MNQNQPALPKQFSRLRLAHSMAIRKFLICGVIILTATLPQPLRADVVILNDAFNDPNNNISLNTNGIGDGFTAFIAGNSAPGGYLREANGQVQFSSAINGACRENIISKESIPLNVNTGLTTVQWNGLHFTNQPLNRARPNCDRVFLGLVNTNTAGDWYHQLGAAHLPAGFYIQIMSDSIVNSNNTVNSAQSGATGNGGWSNGTNVLFYTDTFGYRRELAIWKFDHLYWGQGAVSNYAPTLNFQLAVSPTTWAISVTGDTMNGGASISFNGTYAQSGLTNIASGGTNTVDLYSLGLSPHVLLWDQTEGPGIIMTCSNVVVTENELLSR